MAPPETTGLGTLRLGAACAGGHTHAFACVFPDACLVAALRLDVQRLAMDDTRHSHSQLFAPVVTLRLAPIAALLDEEE